MGTTVKQILQSARTGELGLREVPGPKVRAGHILVRNHASLISAGTERMVVDFAKKSLLAKAKARPDLVRKVVDKVKRDGLAATMQSVRARLDEPLPLGYSATAEVVAVGAGLEGVFSVGQRVAVAGAGVANHADYNVVPRNLAVPIPDGVADEEACFATLGSIAMHGVRLLEPALGDTVGVVGVGLVGQLATAFLARSGARVVAMDYDPWRLEVARAMGAEMTWNLGDGDPEEAVLTFTDGLGCDSVVIAAATSDSSPFQVAAAVARDRAKVSLVGITGTEFPYREFMKKELSVVVSRSYGPGRYDGDYEARGMKYPPGYVRWTETENLAQVVRLMEPGRTHRLDVKPLITHSFDFAQAEDAYALVSRGGERYLGVILTYPEPAQSPESLRAPVILRQPRAGAGRCVLGMIGAGSFARTKLLPALSKLKDCEFRTIATARGSSAEDVGRKFGFATAVADTDVVFDDPEINAVLIATPHSSHAALTTRALQAGKSVFVEKPLALTMEELNGIVAARNATNAFFMVGFNRRFAPMVAKAREHLAKVTGPRTLLLRVNAGQLPADSWQRDADEGNGRILGEVCHFVDLARYMLGQPIEQVQALSAAPTRGLCEDLTVTLRMADGSLATILYTAMGDIAFSKERFECFAGGTVLCIDNFRTMEVVTDGRSRKSTSAISQDKGHDAEMAAFVRAVAEGGAAPIPEDELVESSAATIAVLEALQSGSAVRL